MDNKNKLTTAVIAVLVLLTVIGMMIGMLNSSVPRPFHHCGCGVGLVVTEFRLLWRTT
jgi:hypothetical protein